MIQILFFNGWGMDESIISHIEVPSSTILTEIHSFHQYQEPEIDKDANEVYVIGWSLGVICATEFYLKNKDRITNYIVINGSCDSFSRETGLPKRLSMLTARSWNEKNRETFNLKMNGCHMTMDKVSKRSVEDQKKELEYLMQNKEVVYSDEMKEADSKIKVYISSEEAIFPKQNLERCWASQNIELLESKYHNPFISTATWMEWIQN